jgi:hypothetical protein
LKARRKLRPEMEEEWDSWVKVLELEELTMEEAERGLEMLKEEGAPMEVRDRYKERAKATWVEASAFQESK